MDINTDFLSSPLLTFGDTVFSIGNVALAFVIALFVLLFLIVYLLWRSSTSRTLAKAQSDEAAQNAQAQLNELLKTQSEMQGRMSTMAELFGSRQSELNQDINQRLDGMSQKLGNSLIEQTKTTHENLSKLQERLAVIDTAQNNIQALAQNVVGLQAILSDKQTRGAYGQARMEIIIKDGLPMGAYNFQTTLSNGTRPDCTVTMPNDSPDLVIDAKFPLEAWNAIKKADDDRLAADAARQFRTDMEKHIKDISDKYLIAGETQDTAFMFVPSESIFAEVHENFEGIVQRAHKARVVIVSPSLLMLSIQVIQAVLKDARMREQAHLIQGEVIRLMEDIGRLDDRVRKLQTHFGQSQKDIDQILTSTDKITKRSSKIESMDFQDSLPDVEKAEKTSDPEPLSVVKPIGSSGRLNLRP
ncbi:MAG: DNA recombination protein RmuC [Rhizobiaceae bacterium]|nr:DNA recombination protein RmuC [Rhizobiaceae bacterium]